MTEREAIESILSKYDINPAAILDRQMGYRNRSYPVRLKNGRFLNLIIYKSDADILARIRNANRVSNYLAERGLPTRATADPRILALRTPGRIKYAGLYHYLPGATIPWEAYTRRHLKLLGATLSQVHFDLMEQPQEKLPSAVDEYMAIIGKIFTYYSHPLVARAMKEKLGLEPPAKIHRLTRILEICERLPHQQPLHMDFVRGNILFRDKVGSFASYPAHPEPEVSGILDFEKTAWGHPVFDIARTLAFLLIDSKYKSERHVHKYFLQSGYNKRGPARFQPPILTVGETRIHLLHELTDLFLIYDLYKFMRHNPYESLAQNEHYIRTRDILLQRGVMTPPQISIGLRET